jgi:hypothetical protein
MGTDGETKAETNNTDLEGFRMTLKIWDVPPEVGRKFISEAKAKYGNKSWLLLRDLMDKAEKYDKFLSNGTIEDHEKRLKALETKGEKP